jgi:hypothetical protein
VTIIGSADEGVVVVKSLAYEDMVTYWRVKLAISNKEDGGKGRNIVAMMLEH